MPKQEKLNNQENDSEETPEQKAVSEQLRQTANNFEEQGHGEHEHSHAEETQEQKDKLADEIIQRAQGVKPEIKKVAEAFAEQVRMQGAGTVADISKDFGALAENPDDENVKDLRRRYAEWTQSDFADIFEILRGETVYGETGGKMEERKRMRREGQEVIRQREDKLARLELEMEEKFRQEQEQRYKENRELEERLRLEDEEKAKQKAEDQRKGRWFGLGRFFK